MRAEVAKAVVNGPQNALDRLRSISKDLRAVGRITGELVFVPSGADQIDVEVTLATSEA